MELKFRLKKGKGAVSGFRKGPVLYVPGDEVDLPSTYEGAAWLERVDPVSVAVAADSGFLDVPLEAPSSAKRTRKKSKL